MSNDFDHSCAVPVRSSGLLRRASLRADARPRGFLTLALFSLVLGFASRAQAQSDSTSFDEPKPVPIFSAGMGLVTPFEGGRPHIDPLISPVFLVPPGDH
jgi:hypothetical protein